MIDDDGYRPNVGIVICNRQGAGNVGPAIWSALPGNFRKAELTPENPQSRRCTVNCLKK